MFYLQDNDAKHKSRSTLQWMEENRVPLLTCPASSPDINPIENVWAAVKDFLKRKHKPRTKEELVSGIVIFWKTLSAHKCRKYIEHIHKVMPDVVLNNGGPTVF